MSSIMDWVKNTIGYSEEEEIEEIQQSVMEPATITPRRTRMADDIPTTPRRSRVVNINTTAQLKVVVVQPISYDDAPEIADHLKQKKPVVINLEKLEKGVANRIFEFIGGVVYALDGSMKKVSSGILLVVPNNMGIMGDFSDDLKTQGIFDEFNL